MCGVAEAMAVMSVVQSISGYQAKKEQAKAQEQTNRQAAESANISYLNDLQQIETERGLAAREKALANFENKQKLAKERATALNSGYGNVINIMRDIGARQDIQYVELENEFSFDMMKLNTQAANSYTALQRNYNKIPPVTKPSALGLGLEIASAGAGYLTVPASDRKFFPDYGIGANSPFNPKNATGTITGKKV
jgi:hypothetical protein